MGKKPDLVLPEGSTPEGLFEFLAGPRRPADPRLTDERRGYLGNDFTRFVRTLALVDPGAADILEIGADPYFTTLLLRRFRPGARLTLTNGVGEQLHGNRVELIDGDGDRLELEYTRFNMETDALPFAPGSFDTVLCCEVLEHMTVDPLAALARINEALRPGGRLVLTTPNAARWQNVVRMAAGRTVEDQYSAYGPYGRHNREYTVDEVRLLLRHAGFAVERWYTADVGGPADRRTAPKALVRAAVTAGLLPVPGRTQRLGFYTFVAARKVADPKATKPGWLYKSYAAADLG